MGKKTYPQLAITALTHRPVIRLSKNKKVDVTDEFFQAMMSWITDHKLPGVGKTATKELRSDGVVHFEISLKQLVEADEPQPIALKASADGADDTDGAQARGNAQQG